MTFILKLFFSGLMAFIPSQDGNEVTVVLLNVSHDYSISDGTSLAHHTPLLLARAGSCDGDCPTRDTDIAQFVFADQSETTALDSLEAAVSGGGAWQLSGSDLSVQKSSSTAADLPALVIRNDARGSQIIPTSATEREDISWITSLHTLCPGCTLNSDILASQPPAIVAARFHIRNGRVFTYSIARIGSDVTPAHYERLDGGGSVSSYSQAVATWVGAELTITGDDVQIVEDKFDGSTGRTMTLAPDGDGKVEVAVLNLPPFVPPSSPNMTSGIGKHFEIYYDLAVTPPTQSSRLVPKPGAADGAPSYDAVDWSGIHPQTALWSDLLNAIRLNIGRTVYDQTLCPPTTWP
jgi:hypothetical protein